MKTYNPETNSFEAVNETNLQKTMALSDKLNEKNIYHEMTRQGDNIILKIEDQDLDEGNKSAQEVAK